MGLSPPLFSKAPRLGLGPLWFGTFVVPFPEVASLAVTLWTPRLGVDAYREQVAYGARRGESANQLAWRLGKNLRRTGHSSLSIGGDVGGIVTLMRALGART